jgi:uncharacterized protein with HEPN domain
VSKRGDETRLESVLSIILDLSEITRRHGSIESTLSDKEGQYAALMCLTQIGEKLSRVLSPDLLEPLPIRKAVNLRNLIVHDYDRVNHRIIGEIIDRDLPELALAIRRALGKQ